MTNYCSLQHSLIFLKTVAKDPITDALLIFTDGSPNGMTTYVVKGKRHAVQTEPASAQIVELKVIALVFQNFANEAFNLYTATGIFTMLFRYWRPSLI